ncbi:MAG TPA: hypothetical protein VMW10_00710 [Alphaproteobacteria bacterium]|nr:hypothetical protein [Alphaproteobacteria bacterium]
MLKKILVLTIIFFAGNQVNAVDELDRFIGMHCNSACNGAGELPGCEDCRRTARQLLSR